ncbi:CopG family antitoxin [Saccharopolyspora pogona]|uniref:CopG family antitoxin n=1 Tax=Saccharopolyspora pogona TaxID=333966 RepID=UPI00168518A2|nr:CopG family antitoxin [Saccharopolyspora pogona]
MTTTKKTQQDLPRPAEELDELAAYYDTHDTSAEMDHGQWVEPRPMKTTSLRLPADVVEALKKLAQARGIRYTALLREILEQAVYGSHSVPRDELAQINERLTRIEAELGARPAKPAAGKRN